MSVIAHWDWPDAWPHLLPQLETALGSGDAALVHGAMRVLTGLAFVASSSPNQVLPAAEFSRDVSDLQVPQVAPVILPQLLRVLVHPQVSPLFFSSPSLSSPFLLRCTEPEPRAELSTYSTH